VKSLEKDYPDIEVRVYEAGVDTEYIPKYGMVSSSVLIVNESEVVSDLSKTSIRKAFQTAANSAKRA